MNISGGEGEEHIGRHLLHVEGGEGHDGVQYVEKILIRMSKSCFCQIFVSRTITLVQGEEELVRDSTS